MPLVKDKRYVLTLYYFQFWIYDCICIHWGWLQFTTGLKLELPWSSHHQSWCPTSTWVLKLSKHIISIRSIWWLHKMRYNICMLFLNHFLLWITLFTQHWWTSKDIFNYYWFYLDIQQNTFLHLQTYHLKKYLFTMLRVNAID